MLETVGQYIAINVLIGIFIVVTIYAFTHYIPLPAGLPLRTIVIIAVLILIIVQPMIVPRPWAVDNTTGDPTAFYNMTTGLSRASFYMLVIFMFLLLALSVMRVFGYRRLRW